MQHLFESWPEAAAAFEATPCLLVMLDFDGTLAPLVQHPDLAVLPPQSKQCLEQLAAAPAVDLAVISGRGVADLRTRVAIEGVEYSGNHGRERIRAGSDAIELPHAARRQMAAAVRAATEALNGIAGVYVEDKGATVSLHYRQVAPALHPEVRHAVELLAPRLPAGIRVEQGKKVFELLPDDKQNKGTFAVTLFEEKGGIESVVPIYCGDDMTDETVFEALPCQALTVHVGGGQRQSSARYRLDDPTQVAEFLGRIVDFCASARAGGARPAGG